MQTESVALVQVSVPVQLGMSVHASQVSAGPLSSSQNPISQSPHCESDESVHVTCIAHWATGVHTRHVPPLKKLPSAHEVHSLADGPLQVAQDGSHAAPTGVAMADARKRKRRRQLRTTTRDLDMGFPF